QGTLKAFKITHDLRPHIHAILQGLVDANIALGAMEEAASVLEAAVAQLPSDTELHAMLARVYLDAEDAPAADRAAEKLVQADQSNYPLLFEVAQLYLQQGDSHAAVRALTRAVEPALAKRQEKQLLELLNGALARDPENTEALRLLLRIYTWQRDDDRMRIALERLAEAAQAQELYEEERNALEHLVRLVPFDQSYAERLTTLNEILGADAPSADVPRTATATLPLSESAQAPPAMEEPTESALPVAEAQTPTIEAPAFGELLEPNSVAPETFTVPSVSSATTPAPPSEFEFHAAAPLEETKPHADPSASFADLNEEFADHAAPAVAVEPTIDFTVPFERGGDDEQEIHVSSPLDASVLSGPADAATTGDERVQALLAQELESVDYYLAQGYTDIARDTLDMLERQYGARVEISDRRQRLQTAQQTASDASDATDVPPIFEMPFAPPTSAELVTATPTNGAQSKPQASPSVLDPGLAAVFDEFRSSVEEDTETSSAADYETHYNTGLAYMEMGMIDLAVEEFQTAVALVAPQDGTPRYLQCCNLLGHCFIQQNLARAAALWFQKGLAAPGHSEEEYQALRYELGTAYEQLGELDRAIDTFQEVYGIDVSYRGVADRLRELQAQKTVMSDK